MKVVILAGGYGTRLCEETVTKPKPMVEVGEKPIIWHIMKIYSHYGFNDFVICCGYKGSMIKEFFQNYFLHMSDVTFDFCNGNKTVIHNNIAEPWKVTLIDTGLNTMTGGRIKQIQKYTGAEPFLMTYGDGVSDINISKLVEYHKNHGKTATVTLVHPTGKFGLVDVESDGSILSFKEKPENDGFISGGFFVFNPDIFNYIPNDTSCTLEREPFEHLVADNNMMGYSHAGFWQSMDTLRDKELLEGYWASGKAPWKLW